MNWNYVDIKDQHSDQTMNQTIDFLNTKLKNIHPAYIKFDTMRSEDPHHAYLLYPDKLPSPLNTSPSLCTCPPPSAQSVLPKKYHHLYEIPADLNDYEPFTKQMCSPLFVYEFGEPLTPIWMVEMENAHGTMNPTNKSGSWSHKALSHNTPDGIQFLSVEEIQNFYATIGDNISPFCIKSCGLARIDFDRSVIGEITLDVFFTEALPNSSITVTDGSYHQHKYAAIPWYDYTGSWKWSGKLFGSSNDVLKFLNGKELSEEQKFLCKIGGMNSSSNPEYIVLYPSKA